MDVIVSFETIEHLNEQEQFLSEIKRVLRPSGLLVISSPDRDVYSGGRDTANPFHVRELTAAEFTALLSRHFAHVAASGQRCFLGSAVLPLLGEPAGVRTFERRSEALVEGADGPARAVYIFALASDNPIEGAATSIYIHSPDVDGPARRIAAIQAELQQTQAAFAAADDRLAVLAPDEPGATAPRTGIAQGAEAAARTTSLAGVERSGSCQNAGSGKTGRESRMNLNQGDHINPASQLVHLASVGEWDAAVEVGLHHLGEGQEDGQLFSRIASLLLDAQMIDAAEAYIQQGYIRWPDYVWLPWQYARLATTHRDFEVAAARWQDLMARHPESPLGLSGLAELHRLAGREDDAARLFAEAVTRYPDFVWAAHHHAATSTRCLDWPTATRRWAAVRDRFPDHVPAHEQLANALMEDGRLPEAEAAARRGLAAFPQDESLAAIAACVAERMRERTLKVPAVAAPARTTAPAATRPHFEALRSGAPAFVAYLANLKRDETVPFDWYPYGTMANLEHIAQLVTDELDTLFASGKRIADIGAADGDLAFYLESRGHKCDIFDNGPTNFNGLAGARHMKRVLGSAVNIIEQDLDSQFRIEGNYDLVLFLGILYHLKNPFYVLERLSEVSRYLLLSTRVARHFRTGDADVSDIPAAYLLAPDESNNDATNFWIFTTGGVRRLANRAGWEVLGFRTVGDTVHSNPQDNDRDERAFALLRSRKV